MLKSSIVEADVTYDDGEERKASRYEEEHMTMVKKEV
jgi:hypothetical protein